MSHLTGHSSPSEAANDTEFIKIDGKTYYRVPQRPSIRAESRLSFIWQWGDELRHSVGENSHRIWKYNQCPISRPQIYVISRTTNKAITHLLERHDIDNSTSQDNKASPEASRKRQRETSIASQLTTSTVRQVVTNISVTDFRYFLVRWIVVMHLALSIVEHPAFRDLILCIAPSLEVFLISSANTIRRWIMNEYHKQREAIKARLAKAPSMIHISFDAWTAPYGAMALVGIIAHFTDTEGTAHSALIGLRKIEGCHSGENLAAAIIPVLEEMNIVGKLGYFTCDNATSNDVAIRYILKRLRPDIKHPESRRVRCLGHILNLAVKAFLFGHDPESFEVEVQTYQATNFEKLLQVWRRQGPIGKLHNTIAFIRRSSQRREEFDKVVKLRDDEFKSLTVIMDNSTRWNSTDASISRALKLQAQLQVFTQSHLQDLGDDVLLLEDWTTLAHIHEVLQPFRVLTKQLEGRAKEHHHGSVWEVLPAIELLLSHIEGLKATYTDKFMKTSINNCWMKLNEYYSKTDNHYAVYACATLLHPALRTTHFYKHWTGENQGAIATMISEIRSIWKEQYLPRKQSNTQVKAEQSIFDTFLFAPDSNAHRKTEFEVYITQDPDEVQRIDEINPVQWWASKKVNFPTLRLLAFDVLSIPAMSAECERVFSSAKKMITPDRNGLNDDIVEACECLKYWWDNSLVLYNKPTDNELWQEVEAEVEREEQTMYD